jgi:hypothetical protein
MLVLFYYSFIVLVYYKIIVITINYVNKLFQLLPIINLFTLGFLRSEFKAVNLILHYYSYHNNAMSLFSSKAEK